uniref:Chromosome 11 open reading frame 97 n=1 Tax=Anolis carolinensis TaxID=28377 RepID=R4GD78_ANOCA
MSTHTYKYACICLDLFPQSPRRGGGGGSLLGFGLLWQPGRGGNAGHYDSCSDYGVDEDNGHLSRSMRAADGQQPEPRAGASGSRVYAEYNGEGKQPWKKFVYVEPPKRVKEVLEEELCFRKDECRVKHPSEVALEGIWSLKRNFPVGGFQPASQNQNSLFFQPKYYSRHTVVRR